MFCAPWKITDLLSMVSQIHHPETTCSLLQRAVFFSLKEVPELVAASRVTAAMIGTRKALGTRMREGAAGLTAGKGEGPGRKHEPKDCMSGSFPTCCSFPPTTQ